MKPDIVWYSPSLRNAECPTCESDLIDPDQPCSRPAHCVWALFTDHNIHVLHLCNTHYRLYEPPREKANALAHEMIESGVMSQML